MKETVKEWIAKAEGDYATAGRELGAGSVPNYDAVCFHAQQCIEKLMKGLLIQHGVIPPRTHDLPALDRLLVGVCPTWTWPSADLRFLSRAAVTYRYPGESAESEEAALAYEKCTGLREKLLSLFETSG